MIKELWQNLQQNDYIWIIHRPQGYIVGGEPEESELMRVRLIKKPNESKGGRFVVRDDYGGQYEVVSKDVFMTEMDARISLMKEQVRIVDWKSDVEENKRKWGIKSMGFLNKKDLNDKWGDVVDAKLDFVDDMNEITSPPTDYTAILPLDIIGDDEDLGMEFYDNFPEIEEKFLDLADFVINLAQDSDTEDILIDKIDGLCDAIYGISDDDFDDFMECNDLEWDGCCDDEDECYFDDEFGYCPDDEFDYSEDYEPVGCECSCNCDCGCEYGICYCGDDCGCDCDCCDGLNNQNPLGDGWAYDSNIDNHVAYQENTMVPVIGEMEEPEFDDHSTEIVLKLE